MTEMLAETGLDLGLFGDGPVIPCGFSLEYDWPLVACPKRLKTCLGLDPAEKAPRLSRLLGEADRARLQAALTHCQNRTDGDHAFNLPRLTLRGGAGQKLAVSGRFRLAPLAADSQELAAVGYFLDLAPLSPSQEAQNRLPDSPVATVETSLSTHPIQQLLLYDLGTGLPNHSYFVARLREACLTDKSDEQAQFALHMVGLSDFDHVVHTLGFAAGDDLMRQTGQRLRELEETGDILFTGRLSGNRFALLQRTDGEMGKAARLTEQILALLRSPMQVQGNEMQFNACLGLALYPDHEKEPESLMRAASLALDNARFAGPGTIQIFQDDFSNRVQRHMQLMHGLNRALPAGEFSLHWQPRIDLASNRMTGAEALIRWPQLDGSYIPPAEFIPIAERAGVIGRISRWVLIEACRQMRLWQEMGLPPFRATVNISALDFTNHSVVGFVDEALRESGLDPSYLGIEVTEGILVNDIEVTRSILKLLANRGIEVSIDDFGTGYSSLSYLRNLPVDILKIDRSFIQNLTDNPDDLAITRSIIDLGHNLNLRVVAEGVHSARHALLLQDEGCDEGQGFHFLEPMRNDYFADWMGRRRLTEEMVAVDMPLA